MKIIKIKVYSNLCKSEIIPKDSYYEVHVKAHPEKNKVNIEIIKLFYKKFKKRAKIIKGLKSREKLLKFE